MTPEIVMHAGVGAIALVAGAVAVTARKGERVHRAAGTAFFVTMGAAAASGVYLGFAANDVNVAIGGAVTLYLLATAWATVRRKEGEAGLFELGAFMVAAAGAAAGWFFAIQAVLSGTALLGGIPIVVVASIISLAALADLSVLLRRGLSGRQRIARHLWRMLLGLSVGVVSFFPGQLEFFPAYVQKIRPIVILFIPFFLVIGLMLFWLLYVWLSNRFTHVARAS